MERITTLANRLAESILFDWNKEEVFKLAKEVAVACHENIEFISLVKKMREAQNNSPYKYLTYCNNIEELRRLESEVDEYLKKNLKK